jgi:hypothetical protein
MKKTLRLLFLALCFAGNFAGAADLRIENPHLYTTLRDTTFAPLFEAMRTGDVAAIRQYLSGSTYEKYRVLLEQNKEYGRFLRNYYAGATFELNQVLPSDNGYVADVFIYWPAGRTSLIQLQVHNTIAAGQGSNVQLAQPKAGAQTLWTVGEPAGNSNRKMKR